MFGVSTAVIVAVGLLILIAIRPRLRARTGHPNPRWANGMILVGGLAFPVVVLSVLWVLTLRDMSALSAPERRAAFTVDVIGHQWWWEVRYPAQGIVTANDIHVPSGQPVRVRLTTRDVNHSFWVPQLTGKTDLIAGRTTSMWIQADHPGLYRGQCAEYCGVQHANMIFYVVAEPPARFTAWVARERQAAGAPTDPTVLAGRDTFLRSACVACHTIRGTPAQGRVGPDLTHFGSRISIGAGAVPNTPGNLTGWIFDSQAIKPGNIMPPIQLGATALRDLVAYLESLR